MDQGTTDPLERFRMTRSVLDDVDERGNGRRVVYEDGVWRAWRVRRWKEAGRSSGGWNSLEAAVAHLPPPSEDTGRYDS